MNWKRHFFTPEQVDDQVDQFSLPAPRAIAQKQAQEPEKQDGQVVHASEQEDSRQDVSTQLVQELQAYYQSERQQNQDFLEHAWWRIVAHQPATHATPQAEKAASSSPPLRFSPERMKLMQDQNSRGKRFARSVSTLAASLVALVLVGALVAVLLLSHHTPQSSTLGSGRTPTPTATAATTTTTTAPLPGNVGSIIHTQKSPTGMRSYKLAWSPDSSRIATLSDDTNSANAQLQIWDATTGSDLLSVPFTTSFDEIDWSPTGKYVALTNLQEVVIVNAQTGSVVNTLTNNAFNQAFRGQPASGAGMAPLASFMPDGGGYGFYASVWSPDGTTLAVSISYSTSTKVEFLDPLTGAVKTTLPAPYGELMGLAYSSDGQYLVASNSHLVVWRLSSKAIVYQQDLHNGVDVTWQPGTHNLAIPLMSPASVQLWNMDTHKLVATYTGINVVAWSPDGKELAGFVSGPPPLQTSTSSKVQVIIIDAASAKHIFTYTSSASSIFGVNWSPDGHYIATVEFDASNSGVISVWVA